MSTSAVDIFSLRYRKHQFLFDDWSQAHPIFRYTTCIGEVILFCCLLIWQCRDKVNRKYDDNVCYFLPHKSPLQGRYVSIQSTTDDLDQIHLSEIYVADDCASAMEPRSKLHGKCGNVCTCKESSIFLAQIWHNPNGACRVTSINVTKTQPFTISPLKAIQLKYWKKVGLVFIRLCMLK